MWGGGYHGKSTLLKALEMGVYPHTAGDGREYVITEADAVKIRAEDGRSIKDTDISMFINDLPNGKDTKTFSTEDAEGKHVPGGKCGGGHGVWCCDPSSLMRIHQRPTSWCVMS